MSNQVTKEAKCRQC